MNPRIPLEFWFSPSAKLAVPYIMIPDPDKKVYINFTYFERLVQVGPNNFEAVPFEAESDTKRRKIGSL